MKDNKAERGTRGVPTRGGAVAVEAALVLPLLALLFVGAVDLGQLASCYQKVSDASREGARTAARAGTSDSSDVEQIVLDYLGATFPHVPAETLRAATAVTVRDSTESVLLASALGAVDAGSEVRVEVSLQFEQVRWMRGLPLLDGSDVQAASTMRRE